MNSSIYLDMDSQELYRQFIQFLMDNPYEGMKVIEDLGKSKRYKEDYEFRTYLQTTRAIAYSLQGKYSKIIPLCSNLLDRATALEIWPLVSINKGILGNSYFMFGGYERALECYYEAIKNDKEHGLNWMTSSAYHNIGLIYDELQEYEKSYKYICLAIDFLESVQDDIRGYENCVVFYLSSLICTLCKLERLSEIPALLNKMNTVDLKKICPDALCAYYKGKMYYYFYRNEFKWAKDMYYSAVGLVCEKYSIKYMELFNDFIDLSLKFHLKSEFYKDEMLDFSSAENVDYNSQSLKAYLKLRNYYQEISDFAGLEKATFNYFDYAQKNESETMQRKKESLFIVESLLTDNANLSKLCFENSELKLIVSETVRTKNELQHTCKQMKLINELGKKMTSSLNLNEVVELIYKNLSDNLPIDSFVMMMAEPKHNRLKSVACYLYGEIEPEITIEFDNKDSMFVKSYITNRMLVNNIGEGVYLFSDGMKPAADADMKSAVFIPLKVDDNPIGVCSIQYRNKNAYTDEHIEFLEALLPYLSISLNNAMHSWDMEKEIQSFLVHQKELEKVNKRLEKLSNLDGLTQISSRRDFELKFILMLKKAKLEKKEIAVFMLDIDNFKVYNDTYGHLEGDKVLKKIAQIVRKDIEAVGGLSARFGGEEFISAVSGLNEKKCLELANKVCKDIFDLNIRNEKTPLGKVTVSIGVTVAKDFSILQKSLIMRQADISLYKAKNSGKNRVVLSDYFKK